MRVRIIRRYSECFKRKVVDELESGRFDSIEGARRHYEIGGATTIQKWLNRHGKNHLRAKVVRVEKPDEKDRMQGYRREIAALQRALGQTQAENLLHASYLELACRELGQEVEVFKKKHDGERSRRRPEKRRGK